MNKKSLALCLLLVFSVVSVSAIESCNPSVISMLHFDSSSSIAFEEIGEQNCATSSFDNNEFKTTGVIGGAIQLETADEISCSHNTANINPAQGSIALWVKRGWADSFNNWPTIVRLEDVGDASIQFFWDNSANDFRFGYGASSANDLHVAASKIPQSVWTHVTVTWSSGGNFNVYVNGVLDKTKTLTPYTFSTFRAIELPDPVNDEMEGSEFDEFSIWNKALSASEVSQLYGGTLSDCVSDGGTGGTTCTPTTEVCDGIDNNCDGQIDEGNVCAPTCTQTNNGIEICGNGIDEDCSGADLACPQQNGAPYSMSTDITGITFADSSTIQRYGTGSDNWPMTWGDDGKLYTTYGDGNGFTEATSRAGMGVSSVSGNPPSTLTGEDLAVLSAASGGSTIKGTGILMVNGNLYVFSRRDNGRLWKSTNRGVTWTNPGVQMQQTNGDFHAIAFLQFGPNYANARDNYIYMYGTNQLSTNEDKVYLIRVSASGTAIENEANYEYFTGLNGETPTWSSNIADRQPVLTDNNHAALDARAVYNPGLDKYFLTTNDYSDAGFIGFFESNNPWGPWKTVYYGDFLGSAFTFEYSFPQKWMSSDGKEMYVVFSGTGENDAFAVRKVTLTTSSGGPTCTPTTEICDGIDNNCDGQIDEGNVCAPTPVCGNSLQETGEQCDDGNTNNGDGCSSTCQLEVPTSDLEENPFCKGDLNNDGLVSSVDLGILASKWRTTNLGFSDKWLILRNIILGEGSLPDGKSCYGEVSISCRRCNLGDCTLERCGDAQTSWNGTCSYDSARPKSNRCYDAGEPTCTPTTEVCDSLDNDCDGQIDENNVCAPQGTDNDNDGYYMEINDCNDNNAGIHPNAEEICGNNVDEDCNGGDLQCGSGLGDSILVSSTSKANAAAQYGLFPESRVLFTRHQTFYPLWPDDSLIIQSWPSFARFPMDSMADSSTQVNGLSINEDSASMVKIVNRMRDIVGDRNEELRYGWYELRGWVWVETTGTVTFTATTPAKKMRFSVAGQEIFESTTATSGSIFLQRGFHRFSAQGMTDSPSGTGFTMAMTLPGGSQQTITSDLIYNSADHASEPMLYHIGVQGKSYTEQLKTTRSGATFTILDGSLPSGMTLSTTGLLSGTPQTSGTHYFLVEISNSAGVTWQETYSLHILESLSSQTVNDENQYLMTFENTPSNPASGEPFSFNHLGRLVLEESYLLYESAFGLQPGRQSEISKSVGALGSSASYMMPSPEFRFYFSGSKQARLSDLMPVMRNYDVDADETVQYSMMVKMPESVNHGGTLLSLSNDPMRYGTRVLERGQMAEFNVVPNYERNADGSYSENTQEMNNWHFYHKYNYYWPENWVTAEIRYLGNGWYYLVAGEQSNSQRAGCCDMSGYFNSIEAYTTYWSSISRFYAGIDYNKGTTINEYQGDYEFYLDNIQFKKVDKDWAIHTIDGKNTYKTAISSSATQAVVPFKVTNRGNKVSQVYLIRMSGGAPSYRPDGIYYDRNNNGQLDSTDEEITTPITEAFTPGQTKNFLAVFDSGLDKWPLEGTHNAGIAVKPVDPTDVLSRDGDSMMMLFYKSSNPSAVNINNIYPRSGFYEEELDVYAADNIPPVITILSAPSTGSVGQELTFVGKGKDERTEFRPKLWWDFGDGSPYGHDNGVVNSDGSMTYTVQHTYKAPGTYTVTAYGYDGYSTSQATKTITIG